MCLGNFPGSNIHLDEGMEMCSIRHTKMLNTCVPEILERSPAFYMLLGKMRDNLEINVNPSRKRSTRNAELRNSANEKRGNDILLIDGERKTVRNVMAISRCLEARDWLRGWHRGREFPMNVLRKGGIDGEDPQTLNPFVLTDQKVADGLLRADETGRTTAALHLSAKLGKIFGDLTEDDYKTFFDGKAFTGAWTLAFVKTMAQRDPLKKTGIKAPRRSVPMRRPRMPTRDALVWSGTSKKS